ncbi:hypothetical protein ACFIJ5_11430 [Haloimpatiens sp. FM7330]|uniref:hypothetical protein n=1 Tax=Haloimpatiens sp. FM7330 TaxID=3298610 RepID=UPI003629EDD5
MGFKEKFSKRYTEAYLKKYADRLTQVQGKVLSIKIHEKSILWIFHKLTVSLVVKPDRSRSISKCEYKKNRWFKKPPFMKISQGHSVIVQGLKGKKGKENRESIQVVNILNMTTKNSLVPIDGGIPKVQKIKAQNQKKLR